MSCHILGRTVLLEARDALGKRDLVQERVERDERVRAPERHEPHALVGEELFHHGVFGGSEDARAVDLALDERLAPGCGRERDDRDLFLEAGCAQQLGHDARARIDRDALAPQVSELGLIREAPTKNPDRVVRGRAERLDPRRSFLRRQASRDEAGGDAGRGILQARQVLDVALRRPELHADPVAGESGAVPFAERR